MGSKASKGAAVGTVAAGVLGGIAIACTGGLAAPAAVTWWGWATGAATAATGWSTGAAAATVAGSAAAGATVGALIGSSSGPAHMPTQSVTIEINQVKQQLQSLSSESTCESKIAQLESQLEALEDNKKKIEKEWPMPRGLDTKDVNIAIMGNSGVGKSSLLNKMLGEKKSKTGVNETTMESKAFNFDLGGLTGKLWDVPGGGTQKFPAAVYIQEMGLRYFDALVILTSARWTEIDVELFQAARSHNIPAYIVRSKMDQTIEDNENDNETPPEHTMEEVRNHLKKSVGGENSDRIFLITVRDKKYANVLQPEFQKFLEMLGKDFQKTRDIKLVTKLAA